MHGFVRGITPPHRWRELARRQQQEIEEQMARLTAMQRLVNGVLDYQCVDLSECGGIAASIMEAAK
jgi:hypothetical protein